MQVVVVTLLQAFREKKLTVKAAVSTTLAVSGVALLEGIFDPSVTIGVGVIPLLMQVRGAKRQAQQIGKEVVFAMLKTAVVLTAESL